MTTTPSASTSKVVTARCVIDAPLDVIFEWIADPSRQPMWDGNDNLREAPTGQRIRKVGDVFTMTLRLGAHRHNRVVEFQEGTLVAWTPYEPGKPPPGHLWRWQLEALNATSTQVTHTYDWSALNDPDRVARARSTTSRNLQESLRRLKIIVEGKKVRP